MREESKQKLDVASLFPSKGDPRRPPEWYGRALFYAVIAVYLGWFVFTSYGKITYIVFDIVIALFLALAVEPLVIRLIKHGWKRGVASVTCLTSLLVIVIVLMALFGNVALHDFHGMVGGTVVHNEHLVRHHRLTGRVVETIDDAFLFVPRWDDD